MPRVDQPSLLPKEKRRREVPPPAPVDLDMHEYCRQAWQRWIRAEIADGTWGNDYGDRGPEQQAKAEKAQRERGATPNSGSDQPPS